MSEKEEIYEDIKNHIKVLHPSKEKHAFILGGQPGVGKSTFYDNGGVNRNNIVINGDEFRKYHPDYNRLIKEYPESMPKQTQSFCNETVEQLIEDCSNEGYNLIIEGTLRSLEVPLSTCEKLKNKGYSVDLVVVVCDAVTSYESTLERARKMAKLGIYPRFVPLEKYNEIVHAIASNLSQLQQSNCFNSIQLYQRDGSKIEIDEKDAGKVLSDYLNLPEWESQCSFYQNNLDETMKKIINIYHQIEPENEKKVVKETAHIEIKHQAQNNEIEP